MIDFITDAQCRQNGVLLQLDRHRHSLPTLPLCVTLSLPPCLYIYILGVRSLANARVELDSFIRGK